jgi:hypothetical protein
MSSDYHDHYTPVLNEFDKDYRVVLAPLALDWVTAVGFIVVGALAAVAMWVLS